MHGESLGFYIWNIDRAARHIAKGFLRVAAFHGADRANEPHVYKDLDLVLTTYSTLSSDSQKARVLQRVDWFRVILDEGS